MRHTHFGMLTIHLLCVAALLSIFSCSSGAGIIEDLPDEVVDTMETSFDFLALGDSYTIGEGVSPESRWPDQLRDSMQACGIAISGVSIIAQTGWTTRNLLNAISQSDPQSHDLVSLLIGVNNQFQGRDFEVFKEEFILLLDKAISLSTKGVFVVSIPDYGVTPFGASNHATIAEELNMYNAYMEQTCMSANIPFVNITTISRELGDSTAALAGDRLHPSGFQYSKWVEKIVPVVKDIIAK